MKQKITFLLFMTVLCLTLLAGCKIFDGGDSGNTDNTGNPGNTDNSGNTSENVIYSGDTQIGFVFNEALASNLKVSVLHSRLSEKTNPIITSTGDVPYEHEIVIGLTDRPVSVEAYRLLARFRLTDEQENNAQDYSKFLIYSDGKSVAIAYEEQADDITISAAINHFLENYIRDTLVLSKGTVYKSVIDIPAYYEAQDDKMLEEKWMALELSAGERGSEIVAALKNLYSIYSDDLISWMANLYEPYICTCEGDVCKGGKNCGGAAFYYSNSARDTQGYLPDVESTNQILNFLESSGMVDNYEDGYVSALPESMKSSISKFVRSLQDEDGYFYHPQWGKSIGVSRRGRDLNWSVSILKRMGVSPIYDTANGALTGSGVEATAKALSGRLGESALTAASKIMATASDNTDPQLKNKESFIAYLESLDIKNNSYSAGNTLAAYASSINARDRELRAEGAGYQLMDICIEYLNSLQNPETGTWYWVDKNDPDYSEYYAVNGLMKISCVYIDAWLPMPNIEKAMQSAINAITSNEEVGACVDIYNTWFTISNLFAILRNVGGPTASEQIKATRELLLSQAPEAIKASAKKVGTFLKTDGSFSYNPEFSSYTAQGVLAAVPNTIEGDVNGTVICVTGTTSLIYSCLGLNMVPIYTQSDFNRFLSIVSDLDRVIKDEFVINLGIEDSENYGTGKYKDESLDFEHELAGGLVANGVLGTDKPDQIIFDNYGAEKNVTVVETEENSKVLSFIKKTSGDPYLYVYSQDSSSNSYVFEADICMLGGTTSMDDGGVFYFYFMNGDTYWWSAQFSFTKADNDEYGVQQYAVNSDGSKFIKVGIWYNYRVEIQDISTKESDVRLYINNVLVQRRTVSATTSQLTRMQMRFRLDSGVFSHILLDNVYFSSLEELAQDDTPIIPDINIAEAEDSNYIDDGGRGTGVYYEKAQKYSDTNATLLDMANVIGTSSLVYDPKDSSSKNYTKVASVKNDAVLELGKNVANADPWLYILPTENRDGDSYIFETDLVLMGGTENRDNDDNLFSMYYATNSSNSIYWGTFWHIDLTDGEYYFSVLRPDSEGNVCKLKLDTKKWYNLRIEIEALSSGKLAKHYINGELVHSAVLTASASELSHVLLRFNLYNYDCKMYLDNTYFSRNGEIVEESPEEPEPEIPTAGDYDRGSGVYKNETGTLVYDGSTATELGTAGRLSATGGAALDGSTIYAAVNAIDGNSALTLANNSWSAQGYVGIKAESDATAFIFESDMMIDASVTSLNSSRDDGEVYRIISGNSSEDNIWILPYTAICKKTVNGKTVYTFKAGDSERALTLGEWFNIRIELDDTSSAGSSVRYYVNGELILDYSLKSTTTDLTYMKFWMPPQSSGTLHLDNTYFAAKVESDEPDDTPEAPDPAETVKNAANILSTKTGADGIVVIMHDDASSTIYIIDEVFEEYGLRGNIAMPPANHIYNYDTGELDYDAIATWQVYLDTGRWQISSHSLTHEFRGTTDDDGALTEEVVLSQAILREAFPTQRVLTFAYPGYYAQKDSLGTDRFSAVMRALVDTHYIVGRDSYGNSNMSLSDSAIDWKFSPSYQFDTGSSIDEALAAIRSTQYGEMAVLFTHMIAANNATLATNTMYEKDLRTICAEVAKLQAEGKVWCAFYEDAVLYTREAQNATVSATTENDTITVTLTHDLDASVYNYPLTVRVLTPDNWAAVMITQGSNVSYAAVKTVAGKTCIDASIIPNSDDAVITPVSEIPEDGEDNSTLTANRGTGVLASDERTLTYTDTTASAIKLTQSLGADSTINLDAVAMGMVVAEADGDAALKIGNAWGSTGYIYVNSMTNAGKNYVFETDLRLDSGGSSRSQGEIFYLYSSKAANSVDAYWGMQLMLTKVDGKYYFYVPVKNSDGTVKSVEISLETWYNIRIEMADVTAGGEVKYYINGELVHTGVITSKATSLGSMAVWLPQTTQGILYLDNTFFGALDPVDDTEPEEPSVSVYEKGNGEYANASGALDYADTTATDLGTAGNIQASGSMTLDGDSMSVKVTEIEGDNVLTVNNSDSSSQGFLHVNNATPDSTSKGIVFETDFKLDSASSTRWNGSQDNEVFQFFGSKNGTTANSDKYWGINAYVQYAGGVAYIKSPHTDADGNVLRYAIELDTWYNLRIEIDDMTSSSGTVKYYINGTLMHTVALSSTTTALSSILIWITPSTTGVVHFDNTYFGAQISE